MREPNKGSKAPSSGHTFKESVLAEIRRHVPAAVLVTGDKVKDFWEKLPLRGGDAPLCGVEIQVANGRVWDVFFADPYAFPNGLLIETKWQESPGSAHEKLTHAMFRANDVSIKLKIPTAVVVGGPMFEAGPGFTVVQQCIAWQERYNLQTEMHKSKRDFSNWFGREIRSCGRQAAE